MSSRTWAAAGVEVAAAFFVVALDVVGVAVADDCSFDFLAGSVFASLLASCAEATEHVARARHHTRISREGKLIVALQLGGTVEWSTWRTTR